MVHFPCLKYRHDDFFWFVCLLVTTVSHCVALAVLDLWPLTGRPACLFCLCMHHHHLTLYLLILMFLLKLGLVEPRLALNLLCSRVALSASTLVLGAVVHCHTSWYSYFSCLCCSSVCAVGASTVLMFFGNMVLICSLDWPGAPNINQTGLKRALLL